MEISQFLTRVEEGQKDFSSEVFEFGFHTQVRVESCTFSECIFSGGRSVDMLFQKNCTFTRCTFKGVQGTVVFSSCGFTNCEFGNVSLSSRSDWSFCSFGYCNFIELRTDYTTIGDCDFKSCKFKLSRMLYSTFQRVKFLNSSWEGNDVKACRFVECMMHLTMARCSSTALEFESCDLSSIAYNAENSIGFDGWNVDEECQLPEDRIVIAAVLMSVAHNRNQRAVASYLSKGPEGCWVALGIWVYETFGEELHFWWKQTLMPFFKEEVSYSAKEIEAKFAFGTKNEEGE